MLNCLIMANYEGMGWSEQPRLYTQRNTDSQTSDKRAVFLFHRIYGCSVFMNSLKPAGNSSSEKRWKHLIIEAGPRIFYMQSIDSAVPLSSLLNSFEVLRARPSYFLGSALSTNMKYIPLNLGNVFLMYRMVSISFLKIRI